MYIQLHIWINCIEVYVQVHVQKNALTHFCFLKLLSHQKTGLIVLYNASKELL